MEELLKKLAFDFDEAESWVRIATAKWCANDLYLSLEVTIHDESQPEIWEVRCKGVVEQSISSIGDDTLFVATESSLLIPYRETEVDLMFSENSCNPASLLGLVSCACVEVLEKAEYLHRFLNQKPTVNGIVSSRFGKLGRFPRPLANKIMQVLKDQPIRISPIDVGLPKQWTGGEFIGYPSLAVLELGSSYVIGENFSAKLVQ